MNRRKFAQKLVESSAEKRRILLGENTKFCDAGLAESLQKICYEIWTSQPQKVSVIVEILREITNSTANKEIEAYKYWTQAIESLVNSKLDDCLIFLDKSETLFQNLGKTHIAATTQISKLYALALLGRYDEAVACGLRARDVFLEFSDIYSVGKIEHNIGNLYLRRDFYREAEPYLISAHSRFLQIGDDSQTAMLENNLAFTNAAQNKFREAERIYKQGLKRCKENNLTSIQADIEASISNLYLFQGKFDLALKFMEKSRQKYEVLQMPHQTATNELDIADIYLELNLLPEAVEFYEKAEAKFTEFGMQAELARSFLNHAKALFLLGENELSKELLDKSEKLFIDEGNKIAAASVKLAKAQILFGETDFDGAETGAENALQIFDEGRNLRFALFARWLLGEIYLSRNETEKARKSFEQTRRIAANQSRQIEYLCLVSLGKISRNENYFLEAIELVENSRSSLAAEEFRTAFLSDKLLPYNELVKLKLAEKDYAEAFAWHERSRSKTLLEAMNFAPQHSAQDKEINALREELNWYYSRINRQTASGLEARKEVADLRKLAEKREKDFAELSRRSQMNGNVEIGKTNEFDLQNLQKNLTETTLVEFAIFDGKISAFVVTDKSLEVVQNLADEAEINAEIRQLLFQIKTARFQDKLSAQNRRIAFERMLRHSRKIYDALIRPLEHFFDRKRITFVTANLLHYLPFQALHDGENFLIESFEISFAPSAAILQNSLNKEFTAPKNALLVGVADKITPLVKGEIEMLGELFESSVKLIDKKATLKNLRLNLESADVLHLACHGTFRPDNPAFSSLALFNENLTVGDAQKLDLTGKFVALSACETGLNKIVSGEELIGLTHGFLAAGASSLLLSLWTVNDESTLDLMKNFYREMRGGNNLSKSLQLTQIQLLRENSHPYYWSPFVLIGRW
jgi:CHAT domain-containing protein/tetratricopeptide (TPR) repeat protein